MQSVIILGDNVKTKEKAEEILEEQEISKFDRQIFAFEKQVGIADIKNIQKSIFLKPFQSQKKAIIVEFFNGATIDAQNAFLKVLEEPPQDTIIIILTVSLDFILPTVLSRCTLIDITKIKKLSGEDLIKYSKLLSSVLNNEANPLVIAQNNGKTKSEALDFLENLLITAENELNKNPKMAEVIKKVQKSYSLIKSTNVNVRFALENLFLNL